MAGNTMTMKHKQKTRHRVERLEPTTEGRTPGLLGLEVRWH
jgi:hypothetical protein